MSRPRLLFALLAVAASSAGAQIIRDRGTTAPADSNSRDPGQYGHYAQDDFERYRRMHLPNARDNRPGTCEETVGRFCYWYNENPNAVPTEPADITAQRRRLVNTLDSLRKVAPDDQWLIAQMVRYAAEAGELTRALDAAKECRVGGWYCDILIGFALHELGEDRTADSVYAAALQKMLPRDRCNWRDISMLLDDDTRQQYRRNVCGDPKRTAFEDRVWFLSRVTFARPGNDSRVEWYARQTMAVMMRDAASPHQFGFDDDEKELMLRFGWPRAWARGGSIPGQRGVFSITSLEAIPAYRMIPPGFVLNNPPLSDSTNWALQLPPVVARYAPPYARHLKPLIHQKAMFQRGDSAFVVMAYDSRPMQEMAGAKAVDAALVVTTAAGEKAWMRRQNDAPTTGVLTVKAPWGPLLMSAEVSALEKNAVARARYGVTPPYAVGTRVTLSDLLFYKPYGTFPSTAEEAAPHAHTTERLRADEKLGVFWEAYGTDPEGEKMKISLTVVREVEESGFLRRQAKALKLAREATPVSVTVEDMSARGSKTSARAIELDITTLKKGTYIVQLEIDVAGQYVIRTDHRIEIITP
jgi:hypothetical protein